MCARYLFFLIWVGGFFGCTSYQPKPIIAQDTLQMVEKSRNTLLQNDSEQRVVDSNKDFTFFKAIELLAKNSPSLKEAYAEYKKAYDFAELKTPLPNPQLEIGTLIGSRLGNDTTGRVQPLVSFGFTIPLGSRLTREDEVNSALVKYTYLKYLLEHRSEYLKLRKLYVTWILLEDQKKVYDDIVTSVEVSLDITKRLVEAGVAAALDVGIIELDLQQRQVQKSKIESEIINTKGRLSQILGVSSSFFVFSHPVVCPELPKDLPPLADLKDLMLKNDPTLALLQATYEIAEQELHLEVSKQAPDITLSPSFEGDPGDDKKIWGLSVRFPLPIFDRNERAITDKKGKRELIQTQYEGALNNDLALLEASYLHYIHQQEIFFEIQNKTLAKAKENVTIALETLKRGEIDFLKYVDTERSLRDLLLEFYESKKLMYSSWLNMEQVIGMPFWFLPEEKQENIPSLSRNTKGSEENDSTLPESK